MDSVGGELERLARLRASGDLEEEEYKILKARFIDQAGHKTIPEPLVESSESPQSVDRIVVSADGNEVQIPEGWDDDKVAVEILRGRYLHEVSEHIHVVAPKIATDCVLNQMRGISARQWAELPLLPEPLKVLAKALDTELRIPTYTRTRFKELMKGRKTRNLELTSYGHAFLSCLAGVAYVMYKPEIFVDAFDGREDMLLENAARFVTVFYPALTDLENVDHGDGGSAPFWLEQFPELESVPDVERSYLFDKPFYSAIDQIVTVLSGFKKSLSGNLSANESSEFFRRQRGFEHFGIDLSRVKPRHRPDFDFANRKSLVSFVLSDTINFVPLMIDLQMIRGGRWATS